MALQNDYYVARFEVTKSDCYWKVAIEGGIEGGKNSLTCRMLCYKDQATADTNSNEWGGFTFEFTPDLESADNFIKQAYVYAKTLPEFSGALDV
jgi:hypothetical protein